KDLSGIFDSEKFTKDIKTLYNKFRVDPKSTIWQARFVYKDFTTKEITGYGDLQTNVDFKYEGNNYRIALDSKTGKALNFFQIEVIEGREPMKFAEIVLKW